MGWEAWLTSAVIAGCFALLIWSKVGADVVMVGGLTVLLLVGIITPKEALAGMSNEGMMTVALLYIVAAGLRETGAIAWLVQSVLGKPTSLSNAQFRLMLPVIAMSGFLNNTPVVAMFLPALSDWAKRYRLSVSKLMMPLSYAAIAGGTITLIGTSTNLVVNGLLIEQTGGSGLGMWDITWVGLPCAVVVFFYVLIASPKLLPDRIPAAEQLENAREYTVEMMVERNGPLSGKTVEAAGLRQLPGLFLIEIERDGHLIPAVSSQEVLRDDDRLVFAGVIESVVDLRRIRGLVAATNQLYKLDVPRRERGLVEVVVSNSCPLLGKTIREGRFRSIYNAAVIAVARDGERVRDKIGDIELQAGDTLLLETHASFLTQQKNSRDFYLVSSLPDTTPPRHDRALIAWAIMLGMVITVTLEWLPMIKAAFGAAMLMLLTGCLNTYSARRSIDWQVLIVIAASFAIGEALEKTGVAETIAHNLTAFGGADPWVALVIIYLVTVLCTELITNNAAAVLMFPIAVATAGQLGVDVVPFIIAIMMAASCSFATPIGYQTNLMVYGPGGYHFTDYFRFGIPLSVLLAIVTLTLIPMIWPLV